MSTVIYLLRHAAYENPEQIFHGRLPGFPLSQEGQKQIVLVSHGDPIMVIKVKYLGGATRSRKAFINDYVPPASGYCLNFTRDGKLSAIRQVAIEPVAQF